MTPPLPPTADPGWKLRTTKVPERRSGGSNAGAFHALLGNGVAAVRQKMLLLRQAPCLGWCTCRCPTCEHCQAAESESTWVVLGAQQLELMRWAPPVHLLLPVARDGNPLHPRLKRCSCEGRLWSEVRRGARAGIWSCLRGRG